MIFFPCESPAGPRHFPFRTCSHGRSFALAEDVICSNSPKVRRCHVKGSLLQRDRTRVSAKLSGLVLRHVVWKRLLGPKDWYMAMQGSCCPYRRDFSQRYLGARFTNQTRFRIRAGGPLSAVESEKLVAPELGRSRRMARCVAEIYSSDQVHRSATLVTHVFVSNLLSALCSLLTFGRFYLLLIHTPCVHSYTSPFKKANCIALALQTQRLLKPSPRYTY